ncbi:hypothetical protein Hanom_Chr07g00656041 [Helianthus anomalus]
MNLHFITEKTKINSFKNITSFLIEQVVSRIQIHKKIQIQFLIKFGLLVCDSYK